MRLDTASLPNLHSLLNLDERTDERVVIDLATIEIDRLHNGDVLPELDIDDSDDAKLRLMHEGCCPFERKGRGRSRIDTAMLIQQRAEPVRNCSLRISSRDDLIQLLGRMLVTKSGPDTKVTKGRLSYCQLRFICSRWSESGFLNAKSSSAYNELALAGASSQRR